MAILSKHHHHQQQQQKSGSIQTWKCVSLGLSLNKFHNLLRNLQQEQTTTNIHTLSSSHIIPKRLYVFVSAREFILLNNDRQPDYIQSGLLLYGSRLLSQNLLNAGQPRNHLPCRRKPDRMCKTASGLQTYSRFCCAKVPPTSHVYMSQTRD